MPPPSDAELVEQFVAAASIADSPVERISLLQIRGAADRSRGRACCRAEWAARMRRTVSGDIAREQRTEQAYNDLRTRTLEETSRLAAKGRASDLERLRERVKEEDRRLGGQRAGDIAALLATIDLQAAAVVATRDTRKAVR